MFGTRIPENWEAFPMNNTAIYGAAPVRKWADDRGDHSEERFLSRTFNRRMNHRDTFSKILPTYEHVPKSCKIPSYTHIIHPAYKLDIEGKPFPY